MPYNSINQEKGFNFSKYTKYEAEKNTMKYLFNALIDTNIDKEKNDMLLCDIINNINANEKETKKLKQEIKALNFIIDAFKKQI